MIGTRNLKCSRSGWFKARAIVRNRLLPALLLAAFWVDGFGEDFIVSGNLGVGTETPQRAVHLVGSNAVFRMDRNSDTAAFLIVRTSPDGAEIWKSYAVGVNADGLGNGSFVINDLGSAAGGGGTRRLTISNSGNVGIGTSDPQGLLDVNGAIVQRGGQLHADYVFEPAFNLETIEEHEEYMWKNKHLKGIPQSRRDQDGAEVVEIGLHRRGIVEELEKAHIYIARLNRENKALEEQARLLEEQLEAQTAHHKTVLALKGIVCSHSQDEPLCLDDGTN